VNGAWQAFATTAWQVVSESAFWVVLSLLLGGLIHEFLPASRLRGLLNRRGQRAMAGGIGLGACLPMCSCGVIPLAISLYRSGVRLGPVMAFAAATPIINPAAVLLSLALLGPQITLAYVTMGLVLPWVMGHMSERFGERRAGCCEESAACCDESAFVSERQEPPRAGPLGLRLRAALRWGFVDLGPTIAFYMTVGVVLSGLLAALLPEAWVDSYLRESTIVALLAAAVLGASIYVCAVAHIPFVAALLASGVAPGIAIVYLAAGTATNLPELVALYKTIGRRTVLVYTGTLVVGAMLFGMLVNAWLMPGFAPALDPIASLELADLGQRLQPDVGSALTLANVLVLMVLAAWGTGRKLVSWLPSREGRRAQDSCCPP